MNELNKLIEQYESENPGKKASHNRVFAGGSIVVWHEEFVLWLASRPTCGVEQSEGEKQEIVDDLNEQIELEGDQFQDGRSWSEQVGVILSVKQAKMLVEFLSRPTCGKEQRKFLDEVEKGRYNPDGVETGLHVGRYTVIWPNDTTADISLVIKGK